MKGAIAADHGAIGEGVAGGWGPPETDELIAPRTFVEKRTMGERKSKHER